MAKVSFLLIVSICVCKHTVSGKISCRDEKGKPIDWFINYKLPKLEEQSGIISEGVAYAYLAENKRSSKWTLSTKSISSPKSMLGYSLKEFYRNPEELTYLLYNDNNPNSNSSSVGHTKGIVVFDGSTGVWIIHSVPKFPSEDSYSYPSSGHENGQSVLCITFKTKSLNEIGKQLLYNGPSIYAKHLNIEGLDEDVESLFSDKPAFIKKEPFFRITKIKSAKNKVFTIFAKDNQFNDDLYSELIAPELETSLIVETWRRGSGTPSDPSCDTDHQVIDVLSIDLNLGSRTNKVIKFTSTEDHCKWAISMNSKSKWVCIGDINRMESQKRRGGGSACFISSLVWKAFNSSVDSTDNCFDY